MLNTQLQEYVHLSRYARYLDDKGRRETWPETVKRYCDFWEQKYPKEFPYKEVYKAILNLEVMPSMRALMTAGPALDRDNIAGYNCSYIPIDNIKAFDEVMYVLMCGTGVGFSVERQYIANLPEVAHEFHKSDTTVIVPDSKIGWASSLREIISLLYAGKIPNWDTSKVRSAGSRLKVFGGRASGPEPLDELFRFLVSSFNKACGRKLTSVEVHDIVCKIADVVVVGGVRRSALISLSNLTDERMRAAKSGAWWENESQRRLANNSVAYTEKPDVGIFMKEWASLYESKSGERGIFNRVGAKRQADKTGRRDSSFDFGTNPCGEIILRPNGLCNLTEVVVRNTDTKEDIKRKVGLAALLGTFQSTLTNFRYLRPVWRRNAEDERLLGVSLTGIMDNELLSKPSKELENFLEEIKNHAISVNERVARDLNISPSASITTVKPSGTVSQLVGSSSGIHPRYSKFYLRTVRADRKDPLASFMRTKGFYAEPDVTKPEQTDVFYFPCESPDTSVMRNDLDAIGQLEHYITYKRHWCEHNPSITVYVRESEWMDVGAWVYRNFDDIGGVSFLPHSDHIYRQAPYQEITQEEYVQWLEKSPKDVDWTELSEESDMTTGSQELACLSGESCEL